MMRTVAASLAIAMCSTLADAQAVRVTPLIGGTDTRAGSLVMYVPIPVVVGFDSVPQRYTYESGTSYGALIEWDRASWLDFAALASVNLSTRGYTNPAGPVDCSTCESTIVGLGLLASTRWALSSRVALAVAAGPELLYFGGDAVTTEGTAPPPTEVKIDPAVTIGALGSVGLSYRTRPGQAIRLMLAYRAFAPKYEANEGVGSTSFATRSPSAARDNPI
jgi:hypothetical protein